MTPRRKVIVLGSRLEAEMVECLFQLGFSVYLVRSISETLDQLRKTSAAAIVYQSMYTREDMLEFVLNVRDLDEDIPLLLVKNGEIRNEKVLAEQRGVHIVPRALPRICGKLEEIVPRSAE